MEESEIQFLLKVLLEHQLTDEVRKLFLTRIGEVEKSLRATPAPRVSIRPAPTAQPESTQRILDEMAAKGDELPVVVAQSQVAMMAMQERQKALNAAGKIEAGRSSPRKF
jgi:hypothetical protein